MKPRIKHSPYFRVCPAVAAIALGWIASGPVLYATESLDERTELEFFEQSVRPLLLSRCGECHVEDAAGGLSLASRDALIRGGDSGPGIVPFDADASRMLAAVRRESEMPMPPDHPLTEEEIATLARWVGLGAPWPADLPDTEDAPAAEDHWAFLPIEDAAVPQVDDASWARTAIDRFVLQQLREAGLAPAPQADRRSLIRRVTYSLTGLPPTVAEIEAFLADARPEAYEHLVERLLNSPAYGEHQTRLWLDLARYSDTKGYVYGREERFWVHAWNYRDWVVGALNEDMPYDRFLMLQIAADQVQDRTADDLAAMGFLTLGRRFLGVPHDIIDDRIDVVCRGTMALTVGCARCHNHKYDPIPTADYYSLYGVFDSSSESLAPLPGAEAIFDDSQSDVRTKWDRLRDTLKERRQQQADRVRASVGRYLWAQTELHRYPAEGFDQIFATDDLLPAFVRRFQRYLAAAKQRQDPLFIAWHAYRDIPEEQFAAESAPLTTRLHKGDLGAMDPRVADLFRDPPASFQEVADRYAALFLSIKPQDQDAGTLWQFLYGEPSPCKVPDQGIVHVESYFDTGTVNELWKLQSELDQAILRSGEDAPFALTLVDDAQPTEPQIFRRGNPLDRGESVPRHFLTVLSEDAPQPFTEGSGRLELARKITDPNNPLTARVIVNRIWAQHFGAGLVTTTSDFGRRADPPSHPELLDYLAKRFMEEGWNLKTLHRWILCSATYRQNSAGPSDADALAKAREKDPENRLLWRMNPHRLTFEEMRDSLLASAGSLDERVGGKPAPLLQPPYSARRTLYGLVDRQFLPASFRIFDFASPDLHVAQRSETTIPQQALFLMNHPFVIHQAQRIADSLNADPQSSIDLLFLKILRRPPTDEERGEAMVLLHEAEAIPNEIARATAGDWQYGVGAIVEDPQSVDGFTPLPHWTGQAWQGGTAYPDPTLGWVQLTASGGHPGNDRAHASVRRWVAPRSMVIEIASEFKHEPAAGDGVRASIISSTQGVLDSAAVHQQTRRFDVSALEVAAGETVDFVVDINDVLNSDQYLWGIQITSQATAGQSTTVWDSTKDFTSDPVLRLSPLAQLAQVLMCTNEFMFVD